MPEGGAKKVLSCRHYFARCQIAFDEKLHDFDESFREKHNGQWAEPKWQKRMDTCFMYGYAWMDGMIPWIAGRAYEDEDENLSFFGMRASRDNSNK